MPTLSYLVFCLHHGQHLLSPLTNAPVFFTPLLGSYTFLDFPLSLNWQYPGEMNIYTNESLAAMRSRLAKGWLAKGLNIISEHAKDFDLRKQMLKAKTFKAEVVLTLDSEFPVYIPVKNLLKEFLDKKEGLALIKKNKQVLGVFFRHRSFVNIAGHFNAGTFNFRSLVSYIKQRGKYEELFVGDEAYWGAFSSLREYISLNFNLMKKNPTFPFLSHYLYAGCIKSNPSYVGEAGEVNHSLLGVGTKIEGRVSNCVIGNGVTIKKNARLRHSIILNNAVIEEGCEFYGCLVGEQSPNNGPISPPKSVFGALGNSYVILGKNIKFSQKVKVPAGVMLRDNQVVNKKIIAKEIRA